jgi:hypothetical protein
MIRCFYHKAETVIIFSWCHSFLFGTTAPCEPGPLHSRGFYITQNDAHSRLDSSGRVNSPSQRPLPDKTLHSQQTDIHASGGIRTQNLSRRAAADLRLTARPLRSAQLRPLRIQNELLLATSVISWSHMFMNVANAFRLHILWNYDMTLPTKGSGV